MGDYCYDYDPIAKKCDKNTKSLWEPTAYGPASVGNGCCPTGAFGITTTQPNNMQITYNGKIWNCVAA